MNTFDLLIIYNDGTEHVVNDVLSYSLKKEIECFTFKKNGLLHFLPMRRVRYIGERVSYENEAQS